MVGAAIFLLGAIPACLGAVLPKNKPDDMHLVGTQKDIIPYLAGAGPYFSYPVNYGIPIEAPDQCEFRQVQLIGRHGERYPTTNSGKKLLKLYNTLRKYPNKFNGSLEFMNDYEFFIRDQNDLQMETTLSNSVNFVNPYTGQADATAHARKFLVYYNELLNAAEQTAVFAASSERVHDTAQYFIEGLGDNYNMTLQTVSEEPSAGANTISAGNSCPAWDEDLYSNITDAYTTKYLEDIAYRLNGENPGLNLSSSDAYNMFAWCAYELNARGYSEICDVFKKEELIHYSYYNDLTSFYQDGPGYPMIKAAGSNLFNASVALLQQSESLPQRAYIAFTHDTDILNYLVTIGLFDDGKMLSANSTPFREQAFHRSWQVPQGARVYTQKYTCGNDSYVRYVVNDAVIPIETCSSGPGFSCPEKEFYAYATERLQGQNFFQACNTSSVSNVTDLTFFWDWEEKHYNATLLKQ
ncbi:LAMI_0H13234g1_1 [Lachancea mirantina]|uniref:acid phosphatase n=1 Tax=Lachancea mirantina TaxID=1230905 RepID=A0A1G4KHU9_9SACH|nr:LAMI_0H13234g1_1 [Lachancea mirantina]